MNTEFARNQAAYPPEKEMDSKPKFTILFATDGSAAAELAFNDTVKQVYHAKGRLVLTYFADPKDAGLYGGHACRTDEEWQAYGAQVLKELAAKARIAGVPEVETVLEKHQDEKSLYDLGTEVGANMTTLASHFFKFS